MLGIAEDSALGGARGLGYLEGRKFLGPAFTTFVRGLRV